jgi:DHA2 family multidrug resistance protein
VRIGGEFALPRPLGAIRRRAPRPFLNLRRLLRGNLLLLLPALAGFRFIILSTSYIIPSDLDGAEFPRVAGGAGAAMDRTAAARDRLAIGRPVANVDGRPVLAFATVLVAIACVMASNLTADWATDDFLPSQILQAIGQSFALTALDLLSRPDRQ